MSYSSLWEILPCFSHSLFLYLAINILTYDLEKSDKKRI